jgi:hypothetical protein
MTLTVGEGHQGAHWCHFSSQSSERLASVLGPEVFKGPCSGLCSHLPFEKKSRKKRRKVSIFAKTLMKWRLLNYLNREINYLFRSDIKPPFTL